MIMQHRRYHINNRISDTSSEFDKSEDELFDAEYYGEFRNSRSTSRNHTFRRLLLTIIDIPNTLTNRLRDWLRPTPESRGSTSDKSSGTNSIRGMNPTRNSDRDYYFYKEKIENTVKNNHRHHSYVEKKMHAPSADHRYVKNHHVYHIYKQNDMGVERVVGEQRNYSTSWLQKNGRFSSSPVLVLPRIDPDTGMPIFQPRSHHSRTATESRSVNRREKNLKGDTWRNTGNWEFQENHYTHLRGDTNLIEGLLEKQIIEKSSTAVKENNDKPINHDHDDKNNFKEVELTKLRQLNATRSTAFRETISMRVEVEEPQTLVETIEKKDLNDEKIEEKVKINNNKCDEFRELPKLSTLTQNNVDALLNNLREKINSLNAEKKFNRPVVRLSSLIVPETGSQDRDHLFQARWQDKSGLFARDIKPAYTEARASFAERIQDIWTQENTTIFHNRKSIINGRICRIEREEDIEEEKTTIFSGPTTNETSKDDHILKMSATQPSINHEMLKPSCCHVAVQYSIFDITNFKESLGPSSSKCIPTIKDNKCQSRMQIPQISNTFIERNETQTISTQLPPNFKESLGPSSSKCIPTIKDNECQSRMQIPQIPNTFVERNETQTISTQLPPNEIHVFVQYGISEVANDLISTQLVVPLGSRASIEKLDPLIEHNIQKTVSPDENLSSMNVNATKSQFAFCPQEIQAKRPLKRNVQNPIENVSSQVPFQRKKKLRCPLARLRKIRLMSSMRFSPFRNPRKARILRCNFPKKVGLWLASKFPSGSRQDSSFSVDEARTLRSTKSRKLTCTVRSIFKCIRKSSDNNVPQELVKEECPVSMVLQSNVKPMPPTRLGAQSSTAKIFDMGFKDEDNAADASGTGCNEDIPVDFNPIEPAVSSNRRNSSKRSMTTLSVTTSNSTNIPLQLLGSTSDTSIVPSDYSQDDFNRQADDSNGTEIITRNGEIETCEETDHYDSDSFLPEGSSKVGEKIEDGFDLVINRKRVTGLFSHGVEEKSLLGRQTRKVDTIKDFQGPTKRIWDILKRRKELNNFNIEKNRLVDIEKFSSPQKKMSKTQLSGSDKNAGGPNGRIETCEKIDLYSPDSILPEMSSKVDKISEKLETNNRKDLIDFSNYNFEDESQLKIKRRKVNTTRDLTEANISVRREDKVLNKVHIKKKCSLNIEKCSTPVKKISKTKTSDFKQSAGNRNVKKLRKGVIATCEETEHCSSHLFLPEGSSKIDKISEKLKSNDGKKIEDCFDTIINDRKKLTDFFSHHVKDELGRKTRKMDAVRDLQIYKTNISVQRKDKAFNNVNINKKYSLVIGKGSTLVKKISKTNTSAFEESAGDRNVHKLRNGVTATCKETDHYSSDSFPPEESSKVDKMSEKLESNDSKKVGNRFDTTINYTKGLLDSSNPDIKEKSQLERKRRKVDAIKDLQMPKEKISIRREDEALNYVNIKEKRSVNNGKFSTPIKKISKTKTSAFEESAGDRNVKKLRNGVTATCKETNHYSSDSFPPEESSKVDKMLEKLESNDSKKVENCFDTTINYTKGLLDLSNHDVREKSQLHRKRRKDDAIKDLQMPKEKKSIRGENKALNYVNIKEKRSLNIGKFSTPIKKISKTKTSAFEESAGDRNVKKLRNGVTATCKETDHYNSDSFPPEESSKVDKMSEKLESNDSKKVENCSDTTINYTKGLLDLSNHDVREKSQLDRKRRKVDAIKDLQMPKEKNSIRGENKALNYVNIKEKRSLNIGKFSTPIKNISKIKTSASDKSAGKRNSQKLRLEHRISRIDMVVDESPREESKSESTEIRNAHNRRLERVESVLNIGADDSSNEADRLKSRERKELIYNCRAVSPTGLESISSSRKLRQRMDSPMIPRRSIDSQKTRCLAAGKSSLIPVGIENARCLSTMSKTNEKIFTADSCNKTKSNEYKNQTAAINSNLIARPYSKKTLKNSSESNGKKKSNYRVRFELEKNSSKATESNLNDKKKCLNFSDNLFTPLRKMDDKKMIRKIKSSMENGEPLKKITIMNPCLISERSAKLSAERFGVEKDVIDQAGETCFSDQNFTRREKTRLISEIDNETGYQSYPYYESSLSEQIPKTGGSFEKRHHNENEISYRSLLMEEKKNSDLTLYPVERTSDGLAGFVKSESSDTLGRTSVIDFARIREQVENEILEQTSRSSGTEDCDCAIVLIKAINSSMELSDA